MTDKNEPLDPLRIVGGKISNNNLNTRRFRKTFCNFHFSFLNFQFYLYFCRDKIRLQMSPEMIMTIQDYFKTQPVLKAWVFGSYARGEETEDSDVDILVVFDRKARVSLIGQATMMLDLEELLKKKVDLVKEGTLLPFAMVTANHDKKLIYEKPA